MPIVIFGDLGWDSALLQNRIAQYLVEKGYGLGTAAVPGGTIDLFEGLRNGDVNVLMELWLPNHIEAWEEATIAGEIVTLGESLTKLTQSAFMIPAYLQDDYPQLDSVEDLADEQYRELFATATSEGLAILVSCPGAWACNGVNQAQIDGYGLGHHVRAVTPESEAELHRGLYDAYEKRQPWLGYLDSVMGPSLKLNMIQLEEPSHTEDCWATTKACAYAHTTLVITARPELLMRLPEVAEMLRGWHLDPEAYSSLALWRIDNDADHADAAIWWLENNSATWRGWVNEAAAAAIQDALDAGERADGWP